MSDKPLSKLGISAITVSVEIADKTYGSGESLFMSVGSRLPESTPGLPLTADEAIDDGIDKYLVAWQTLLQAALAEGRISQGDYKRQTVNTLHRVKQVRELYRRIVKAEAV
jgi:hypothetical protein